MDGRHVGLDFYDLLIEAIGVVVEVTKPLGPPVSLRDSASL
jgi:hypothetical protein